MFARAGDGEPFACQLTRLVAMQDAGCAGEVAAGERFRASHDVGRCALGNDVSAETTCSRAEVEHIVGMANCVFIVLDDEDGVAEVAELFQRLDEARVVALVQSDRRFIEDVQNPAQTRADLCGEADALTFATGERGGVAIERQDS